ncbi:MAG: hypothetical protein Q8O92_01570 [Candidatus Latescibacter sp.]|nr:hypothetical protein [Candidatus Latescibacter sp.]
MWKNLRKTGQKRKLNHVLAFAAVMAVSSAQLAQGAFFDTAGKSARPMGMGEVFLTSAGDASSYWYNPAGLAKLEKRQVGLSYGIPVAAVSGLNISQVNFATPLGKRSGLGIGVSYGGIDVASDMVISGGYALSLTDKFALGGNVKIMRWSFEGQRDVYNGKTDENISKTAFSLDLSATYALGELFGLGTFTTGVYVKDAIMPNISESGDEGGKLPVEPGIGLMMQKESLIVEGDVAHASGNTIIRVGAESGITGSNLKIRAGAIYTGDFKGSPEKTDVNLGLGYVFGSVIFNYAYNIPFQFKNTDGKHYVSFGVSF